MREERNEKGLKILVKENVQENEMDGGFLPQGVRLLESRVSREKMIGLKFVKNSVIYISLVRLGVES